MSDFTGFGLIAIVAGSALIGAGRKLLERRRARRELRTKPLLAASSPEGEVVRVTGIVQLVDDESVTAPLSGRMCVVARSRVKAGGKLTSQAHRPEESLAIVPFIIDRGERGRVLVEGNHALLDLAPLHLKRKQIELDRRAQFCALHGLSAKEVSRAFFEETIVEPGQRVSVAGLMMKDLPVEPAPEERGFRDSAAPNLRLAGNVEHPLVIGAPVD